MHLRAVSDCIYMYFPPDITSTCSHCSVSWQVNTVTSCESRQFYSMNFCSRYIDVVAEVVACSYHQRHVTLRHLI